MSGGEKEVGDMEVKRIVFKSLSIALPVIYILSLEVRSFVVFILSLLTLFATSLWLTLCCL